MDVENKTEVKPEEEKPEEVKLLEMPDVVSGTVPADYPEISEFLQKMKIKTGFFGYQKEDVLEKMQQLNSLTVSHLLHSRHLRAPAMLGKQSHSKIHGINPQNSYYDYYQKISHYRMPVKKTTAPVV